MQVRFVAKFAFTALTRAAAVALAWGVWRRSERRGTGRRGAAAPPSGGVHEDEPAGRVPASGPAADVPQDHGPGWSLDLSNDL